MRRLLLPYFAALLSVAFAMPIASRSQPPDPPATDAPPISLPEAAEPLSSPRDEAGDDRVTASALYAHGRMLERRRDPSGALRRFQRAFRYHPDGALQREIVAMAMELGKLPEAARYALLPGGNPAIDSIALRRLALDATNRRDWSQAASLYEASLARSEELGLRTATHVLLRAELGRLYFLNGDFERAHGSFGQVRSALADPEQYDLSESNQKIILGNRRETYGLMARCALEANQLEDAASLFAESHQEAPNSMAALIDRARLAQRRGDAAETERCVAQVLERGDFDSGLSVELLRQSLGKLLSAEQIEAVIVERLKPVLKAHTENAFARIELARAHAKLAEFAEAATLLAAAAKKSRPDEWKQLYAEVLRNLGDAEQWLQLAPLPDEEIAAAAGNEMFSNRVMALLRGVSSDDGDSKPQLQAGALMALQQKNAAEASRLWEAALPTLDKEKADSLLLWGLKLTQADEYGQSMAAFQKVIDLSAGGIDLAAFYLAGAAALDGDHEAALAAIRKAIEARPEDVRFLAREAWVLHHAKRHAEARTRYDDLLRRFEKSMESEVRTALCDARLVLSAVCTELGDQAAAIESLEQVLDEFPEHAGALNDLAYSWAENGKHLQRSLRMAQRATSSEPENKAFRDTLGWVYFRLGRAENALAELEKITAVEDASGTSFDHLGDVLASCGRAEDAQEAWRRALQAMQKEGNEKGAASIEKKLAP